LRSIILAQAFEKCKPFFQFLQKILLLPNLGIFLFDKLRHNRF